MNRRADRTRALRTLGWALLLACACGSGGPERAQVERFCGDGRTACIERCGGGGDYVPEQCRGACEAGHDACRQAPRDHCEGFGLACASLCQNARCTEACEAAAARCARAA